MPHQLPFARSNQETIGHGCYSFIWNFNWYYSCKQCKGFVVHINCTLPVLPTTMSFYDIKSKSLILHSSQGHPLSLQKHIKRKFYLPLWVIKCHEFFLQKNISMLKYRNYFPLIIYMTVSLSKSYFYLIFASQQHKLFASTSEYTAMPVMELMKLNKSLISDQWGYEKKIVPKDEVGTRLSKLGFYVRSWEVCRIVNRRIGSLIVRS